MFRIYSFIIMLSILAMPAFAESFPNPSFHFNKKIILHFDTMFGVQGIFLSSNPTVSTDPTLRDVLGDYQSWKINKSVNGVLFSDGKLIINIKGLIFGDGSPNDEDHFRALVSCQLTPDTSSATATFSKIITDPFPVDNPISKGNAHIKTKIKLPHPCVAPVVMILNGDPAEGNVWFSVTGK